MLAEMSLTNVYERKMDKPFFPLLRWSLFVSWLFLLVIFVSGSLFACIIPYVSAYESKSELSNFDTSIVTIAATSFSNAHHYPQHRLHRIQRQLHQQVKQQRHLANDSLEGSESTLIIDQTNNMPSSSTSPSKIKDTIINQELSESSASSNFVHIQRKIISPDNLVDNVTSVPPTIVTVMQTTSSQQQPHTKNDPLTDNNHDSSKAEQEESSNMNGDRLSSGASSERIFRRRQSQRSRIKVRRSNEFDVLTPSDLAMLRLNNKRKLLKKVIKLRKKNGQNSQMVTSEETSDSIGEYGSEYPTTISIMTTISPAPPPPKREKIICLTFARASSLNESFSSSYPSSLMSPKCFYALDNENGSSSFTEQQSNSIQPSSESGRVGDILHTEESSSSRLFRNYMPPLLVPQTTTKSFFKRIGFFSSSSGNLTGKSSTNMDKQTATTMTTTTTTETPSITFERQAQYNFVTADNPSGNEENSIDSNDAILEESDTLNPDTSAEIRENGPHVNVYEYPQVTNFQVVRHNNKTNDVKGGGDTVKSSPEYYQLVDSDVDIASIVPPPSSTTTVASGSRPDCTSTPIEQIDSVVLLGPDDPNRSLVESNFSLDRKYEIPPSLLITTPSPPSIVTIIKDNNNQDNINKTLEDSSLVKDLWQVTKRKKQSNKKSIGSEESSMNLNTTATSMMFERYASQQQQQTSNKRPLRIPKLLLPKVNRPAMYSLNGYVPKPSFQRRMNIPLDLSRKNKTRRLRNQHSNPKRKSKKSRRRNSHSSSTQLHRSLSMVNGHAAGGPWKHQSNSRFNKVSKSTGKNGFSDIDSDVDDDDYSDEDNDDINGNDMIETSETISHQNSHRHSSTNTLVPHSGSSSTLSSDEKRKTLSSKLKKNGMIAPKASLSTIPKTSFECNDKRANGVYADEETGCQVWHICQNGQMHSFLCPIGTIFNSKNGVCDWWYNTVC